MAEYRQFAWMSHEELERRARCDIPWRYYLNTEVYIVAPDCHGTVRPVVSETGGVDPPLGSLHVITAIQPDADPLTAESRARLQVLDAELRAARIASIPAVGSSVGGGHSEESRAVFGIDDAAARELGLKFGQVAVFSWSGPMWSLLACASTRQDHRAWRWVEGHG
ncbi:DUF3293 domain-containing protein [Mycolicibacter sinensis]|uniref:DUF3293 domain-containing protein n=1 Tax=Mycolicibacter sinensis (strain JDM601) TaxID=875328 RepID=UPI00059E4667|nr:DUF3293 domain-containing protein [Mycolicibacter sinensis]